MVVSSETVGAVGGSGTPNGWVISWKIPSEKMDEMDLLSEPKTPW